MDQWGLIEATVILQSPAKSKESPKEELAAVEVVVPKEIKPRGRKRKNSPVDPLALPPAKKTPVQTLPDTPAAASAAKGAAVSAQKKSQTNSSVAQSTKKLAAKGKSEWIFSIFFGGFWVFMDLGCDFIAVIFVLQKRKLYRKLPRNQPFRHINNNPRYPQRPRLARRKTPPRKQQVVQWHGAESRSTIFSNHLFAIFLLTTQHRKKIIISQKKKKHPHNQTRKLWSEEKKN